MTDLVALKQYIINVDESQNTDYKSIDWKYTYSENNNKKNITIKVDYYDKEHKHIFSDTFKFVNNKLMKHKNLDNSEEINELFVEALEDIVNIILREYDIKKEQLKQKKLEYKNLINNIVKYCDETRPNL